MVLAQVSFQSPLAVSFVQCSLIVYKMSLKKAAQSKLHLRNLLTHTLLFWHFLENLNFELKSTLEYIRTMCSSNACLFSETIDSEHLRY